MVGNIPNYRKFDILRCFLKLSQLTSRADLVKKLELGEGTVRTLLDILKNKNLITSNRQGHMLNKKGIALLNHLNSLIEIKKVDSKKIYPEYKKAGLLIRDAGKTKISIEHRDIAVRSSAFGALLLRYDKKLTMPECDFDSSDLDNLFNYKNGNILVVTFASTSRNAENAALAVASEISPTLKEILNKIINSSY
jgi:predicted transcriptional regulator